jgi:tetratricopeptide (TPR) repeat protein
MADSNREEIAKLEALYANNPGGRVFTHLAEAYRKSGNLERARAILEQGITRHADSASAHVVLGRVLSDLGAHGEAAGSFERVLQLDPENRVALRWLGDLARQSGKPWDALTYFRQLSNLDPSDEEITTVIETLQTELGASIPAEPSEEELQTEMAAIEATEPEVTRDVPPVEGSTPVPISSDFALDWETTQRERDEGLLPGDLARLSAEAEASIEKASEEATTSSFEEPTFAEATFAEPTFEAFEAPTEVTDIEWIEVRQDEAAAAEAEPVAAPEPEAFEIADYGLTEVAAEPEEPAAVVMSAEVVEEISAELPPEPSFEDLLASNNGGTSALTTAAEPELPTETLAELYRSQGFPDRAADVYRVLLQERPDDEELEAKLREVEALRAAINEPEVFRESGAVAELPEFAGVEPVTESPEFSAADATEPAEFASMEPAAELPQFAGLEPTAERSELADLEPAAELPVFAGIEPAAEQPEIISAELPTAAEAEAEVQADVEAQPEELPALAAPDTPVWVEAEAPPSAWSEPEAIAEPSWSTPASAAFAPEEDVASESPQPGDVWVEGVASGWKEPEPADAATMYAWSDDGADEEPGGITLGVYLQTVLAWRPTAPPPPPPAPPPPVEEPMSEAPIVMGYAEATGAPTPEPMPTAPTERVETRAGLVAFEPPVPMPWDEPMLAEDAAPARALRDVEPPQAPPPPPEPVRPAVPTSVPRAPTFQPRPGTPVEDAFDEWFSGGAPSPEPAVPATSSTQAQDFTETEEESDDDLEMFRSWLQSLKR